MILKINGVEVDIKKCDDSFLTTRQGVIQGILKVAYIVLGVLAGGCLLFALVMGFQYGVSFGLQMFLMMLAFLLGISLIFFFPFRVLWKEQKEIRTEIARRVKATNGETDIEAILKQKSRRTVVAFSCFIAVVAIVAFCCFVLPSLGSNNNSTNADKCRNCGRETDLVEGFNYCYDCYEGFVDWQEDNWTEDD